jgi:hypothetical protein
MSLSGDGEPAAAAERGGRDCFDYFDLFHRVGTEVDFGRLHLGVTEPKLCRQRYFSSAPGFNCMKHCCCVI